MNRTITRRFATVAAAGATLACVALTALAGTGVPMASFGTHNPPDMHLATQYCPQVRAGLL